VDGRGQEEGCKGKKREIVIIYEGDKGSNV
jgi:hypothetical protein